MNGMSGLSHIQRIAEWMGCTWRDIVNENRDLSLDEVDEIREKRPLETNQLQR
jgi:hypothetical protein